MTEFILKYSSVEALAHNMHDEAEISEPMPYSPRPYNYHAPSDSRWWLVPSTDWPAYHHGKYVFVGSPLSAARLLCGLHTDIPQSEVWSAHSVWRKLFHPWRSWVI